MSNQTELWRRYRKRLVATSIGVVTLLPLTSHADLIEYQFISPTGEQQSLPADTRYVNPVEDITFALSAGIDRRVEVSLIGQNGDVLYSETSNLLGSNDRIHVGNNAYYGARLTLPTPPPGTYEVAATILSASGDIVEESKRSLTFDFQPPSIDGDIEWIMRVGGGGSIDIFTNSGTGNGIRLEGLSDDISGISHAYYFTIDSNGHRRQIPVDVNIESNSIYMTVGNAANANIAPIDRSEYTIGFAVYDHAGNFKEISQISKIDRVTPKVITQVYNSIADSWENYSDGMTVYENPVRIRWLREKADHVDFNGTDYGWHDSTWQYETGQYIAYERDLTYPAGAGYFRFYTKSGNYSSHTYHSFIFDLQGDAALAPEVTKVEALWGNGVWEDLNKSTGYEHLRFNDSDTLSEIRFEAEERTYPQVISIDSFGSCLIPAGSTVCSANMNVQQASGKGFSDYLYRASREDGELKVTSGRLRLMWDYNPPAINNVQYDTDKKIIDLTVLDQDTVNNSLIGEWNTYDVKIRAVNQNGEEYLLPKNGSTTVDYNLKTHTFSFSSIPSGAYTLTAIATDTYGNVLSEQISEFLYIDNIPPNVEILVDEEISSIDDIRIRVTDNIDQEPRATSARITGGPANDDVNLATVRQAGSVPIFGLEYPVIFPSMTEGEEYRLEVTARDASGNETIESKTFRYQPRVVSLSAENGGPIQIPARVAPFLRNGGGDVVLSEPLLLSGGAPVAGTYDVYATLRTDAEVPLMINGVRVTPGDTQEIMGQHNFSTSGGRLSIPVYPAEDGVIGTSTILVTTTAPNAPVLLVEIETWEGDANLTGSGWNIRQVIDPLSYTAAPSSSTFCRFSTRESEARQADAISNPTCFFTWDRLPGELKPVERRSAEEAIPALEGIATDQGPQSLAYSLFMFDANGAKVKVGGGTRTLNVLSAGKAMEYAPVGDYSRINRVLDPIDLVMNQTAGPECVPTLSESAARSAAERYGHDPIRRSCYFEWSQVPTGLDQAEGIDVPQLLGTIGESGDHNLRWNAYIFSPEGYRVAVAQQSHTLSAVDPDAPAVDLTSEYHHEGDTYIVPQNRNSLGGLIVDGLPTDIRLDIKRGAEQIENDVFTAGWGTRNRLVRNLRTGLTPVWQETLHSATAIYEKVPDIRTVGEYRVITAPSEDILPLLEMDSTTVLDTEPLKLTVKMRSMLDRDGGYDAGQMGNWRVRLLNQRSFSEQEPMTEWVDAANGDAAFEIEMERLTDSGLRLVAEAELLSPIEGYERIVTSRPSFVQVLRGGAIDGDVTSRRFTGPAPLTAVFRIELEDRLDQQALGDVVWQVSNDDGATWVDQEVDARRQSQFYNTFEEGEYLLRAFMRNRNSGAESYTEQVQIVSYTQPEVSIEGPGVLFVDDTYTYLAEVTVPETAKKSADEAIVEWSLDAGETWTHTGRELDLTSTEEARFALRARTRMPEAPEIDRNAFDEARLMVNFRDVVAPRVRVRSYTLLEEGRPYIIEASARVPYRGMAYDMKGYFTLPDGTTREGQEIEYVPTLADAEAGSATFTYTAWVDGFKEETLSTGSSTSRVWQYVWPEFYVTQRLSTDVAPAQVSMSIRHRDGARNLDNPTYEWQLPEGIEELQERGDSTRLFKITEPGQHHVRVTVQDERGHSSLIEHVIELGEPAPYDINLRFTPSNSFMREPLDVRLRPTYRGGHPHDRVSNQRFRVNGEVIAEDANSTVATLTAGRHEIVFEIETNHGVHDQERIFIDVAENQIPVCDLELSESLRNWIVRANCTDEDGRVRKYHWLVNGEENTRTSNRLGILKRDYDDEMPQVVLIAVDDSGGASQPVQVAE